MQKPFLASQLHQKAGKESTFRSDITSRADGPANHTSSNIGAVAYNDDEKHGRVKIRTND
jgi:hypothetical protein